VFPRHVHLASRFPFSYNLENSSTRQTPFFANFSYHPTFELTLTTQPIVPAAADLAARLDIIHAELRAELAYAQDLQSKYFNTHALPAPDFQPDQLVWLLHHHIKSTRPSAKLDHRHLRPYPIHSKISPSTYCLRLPSYLSRLHPVFNVNLLEPYSDPSTFHPHSSPLPFNLTEDPALTIQSLQDCRKIGHRYEYLVRWRNLPNSENSWIPLSDIPTSFNETLKRFHHHHPCAPHPHHFDITHSYSPTNDVESSVITGPHSVE
jgi:Chromo (CHRromatin Organisation MOdifier) domain